MAGADAQGLAGSGNAGHSALPLLLTLTYRAYWRSTHGDYVADAPLFRIRQRLRETGKKRPALEPAWGLW